MKLLALAAVETDLVDADVELKDGSRSRIRFDLSPQDDGALASWEPDVFHDEPMPQGSVSKFVEAVRGFNALARHLDA